MPVACLQEQQWLWQQALKPSLNNSVLQRPRSTFT
jgi:hypothetical protein